SSRKDALSSDCTLLEAFISCLIRSGEYRDAALTAVRIMQMNPGRPMDYCLCALACHLEGSFHTALYAMRENFRICGSSKKSLLMYGRLLLLATEAQEAALLFSECKNSLPNTVEVRYLHTAARILSGSDQQSESVSEYAARFFQAEKGELRAYIGDYRQAARMLAEEIRQDPDDSSLRTAFARVLFELEQYGEGLSQLSLAAGRYGYDKEVQELLDEGLKMLRMQGPLEDLKTISSTPERYAELLHERAVSLKRYGVVRLAAIVCMTLINIESDSPVVSRFQADAYHMLGDLEENEERYEQAIVVYDQLLQNDPDNPALLAEKGLVLDNLHRFDEAEQVLLRALELDPSSGVAHSALCWCLSNRGRHEEALVHGNQAVILMPHEWGAWNNRGLSRLGLRDFEGAVSDFRQAVRCQPGEVIARRNLCDALAALDDADAYEEYDQIIVRFGKRAFPEEEEEMPAEPRVPGRPLKTPVGYMDGYW
ncbi:tetratricopeptide repeat protein, partial [Methanospirillum hungatei]|uniref:tetratricopeptide repeat protein n=1 Tax=Methanospirillum hungatei TaxID=2203 RepID=UPI0026F148D7